MSIQRVYSKNAAYQKFEVLKTNRNKRYRYNAFFVEGVRNINEAIANGWTIQSFLYCPDRALSHWAQDILHSVRTEVNYELSDALMRELSGKEDTSELLAVVQMRDDRLEDVKLSDNPVIALFDRPSNKGNLGTIIRSCDSFGLDCLLITGHAVDLYEPDVVSSSMGSFFNVHTVRVEDNDYLDRYLDDLKRRYPNLQIVGTTAHHNRQRNHGTQQGVQGKVRRAGHHSDERAFVRIVVQRRLCRDRVLLRNRPPAAVNVRRLSNRTAS